MTNLTSVKIELIGYNLDDPLDQEHFGSFRFIRERGVLVPYVDESVIRNGEYVRHKVENIRLNPGQERLEIPGLWSGDGVAIYINKQGKFRFVTGLHPYSSGSGGQLAPSCEVVFQLMREAFAPAVE